MDKYIERDAAINAVFEAYADGRSAYSALEAIPAADVRPVVRGHFGKHTSPFTAPCSECGTSMNTYWNYCPNCGADMRKDGDEE